MTRLRVRRRLAAWMAVLAIVAHSAAALAADGAVALVGATVIDGTGRAPVPNGVVVVDDGRFVAVGRAGEVAIPAGAKIIDASGDYVIPGLMDANVHLLLDIEIEPLIKYEGRYGDLIIEAAQVALRNGVTTVFDTWGPRDALLRAQTRIGDGEAVGSRFFFAGNIIGFDGPFSGDFFRSSMLSEQFAKRINDEWEQGVGQDLLWRTPDEVRKRVRDYIHNGHVDFIKYASSGHTHEQYLAFSPETQRAIVQEGHKAGLVVDVHSTSVESLRLAVNAGADVMQHCDYTGIEPIPATTLRKIVDEHVACAAFFVTDAYYQWTQSHDIRENFSEIEKVHRQNDEALIKAGAVIALATDAGILRPQAASNPALASMLKGVPDTPTSLSDSEFLWFKAASELGMKPMDALVAATRNVARAYKRSKDLGTIERGKRADLVVLTANPLRSPDNYRAIRMVMKDGLLVDRDHLPIRHFLTRP
ncbi:MAG TPA: amidohydrolase family protein [Steroidobacteraceae bacterium]|nr:amidohydrolase family protein [Steroidobacteraceae bacterium]